MSVTPGVTWSVTRRPKWPKTALKRHGSVTIERVRLAAGVGEVVLTEDLRHLTRIFADSPVGLPDRALLLLGLGGAFLARSWCLDVVELEFVRNRMNDRPAQPAVGRTEARIVDFGYTLGDAFTGN